MDIRECEETLCDGSNLVIAPDIVADFRNIPFPDNMFSLVIFDPPHLFDISDKAWLSKKYGKLDKKTWKEDIKKGFSECMRVLKPDGILVFKWSESQVRYADVLTIIDYTPLITDRGRGRKTLWAIFMKGVK